ncbi:hypothetical protein DYBT9623_04675 [Dyadobacter sp. CECT 9623]|uniref:Outer membrane protein beta-barrel domain-containing protein n=1 Tax=Dyadobacter linearis TaxID=2823330 RepID=A0ABN7RGC7_9BACT|nr:hypothetical protein [Dyadobacter sp. CECT 9623]CAG5073172.1 hypothetical protein DYBT9623_04675 [Dyadobacter sp. CECT 9623]
MKKLFCLLTVLFALNTETLKAQASVGYYPWSSLLSVSTNPRKAIWLDTRFQTNSLFSSLSVDLLPMINLKRGEVVQWYIGGGLRLNPLYRIADADADLITIDGYSLNVGVRISPLPQNRNIQLALELNPYVKDEFDSGVLKSHFGLVYVFGKKKKTEETPALPANP